MRAVGAGATDLFTIEPIVEPDNKRDAWPEGPEAAPESASDAA